MMLWDGLEVLAVVAIVVGVTAVFGPWGLIAASVLVVAACELR